MRLEEFIATHSPHEMASPNWSEFESKLRSLLIECAVRNRAHSDTNRRVRRELLRYLRLEESGHKGTFPRSIRRWGDWTAFETEWTAWSYTSPNTNKGTAGIVERRAGGSVSFSLSDLGVGLTREQQAAWITSHMLWQSRATVERSNGRWRLFSERDRVLGRLDSVEVDWSCIPATGVPEPHRFHVSFDRNLRATRDDLDNYGRQLLADLQTFKAIAIEVSPLASSVVTPPNIELLRVVQEQNTFTMPEGQDGRVDQFSHRTINVAPDTSEPQLVATGQIGPVSLWVYAFTDRRGNDVYAVHQLCSSCDVLSRVRAFPGYATLTPSQVMLFSFAESLQSHDFCLVRKGKSWAIGSPRGKN